MLGTVFSSASQSHVWLVLTFCDKAGGSPEGVHSVSDSKEDLPPRPKIPIIVFVCLSDSVPCSPVEEISAPLSYDLSSS